ncbi:MAG: glutamyl-tRNA reductase [Pseudomonadota bacterium]
MTIVALGLNHNTAPIDVREQVAFATDSLAEPLSNLKAIDGIDEAAIVSTCNRTEIYCGLEGGSEHKIAQWLHQYHSAPPDHFAPYLVQRQNRDAVQHLLRVSCGLDSMVLGEPQILGQVKQAYSEASKFGTLGTRLNDLFQHAFKVAKRVRSSTEIGQNPVSVAFAAVTLARQIFNDLRERNALLIGAGETIELTARHLHTNGIGNMTIANRSLDRAAQLASRFGARAERIADVPRLLESADIVVSSTASQLPILGKGAVEQALKVRKHRMIFMIDLAVPRDIEPQVAEIEDVFLYAVDDLQKVIVAGQQKRLDAAMQAEEIVSSQVEAFMRGERAKDSIDLIRKLRDDAEDIKATALKRAQSALALGKDPQTVIEDLAHSLNNKILHQPTQGLRKAAEEGDETVLNAARKLFDLDNEHSK